jgi:hypothetical protein
MKRKKTDYIYKTTIKETYGLTDSWIKRMGEPDKTVPNPYYSSRKSYLYLRVRVEAFIDEHQDEYKKLLEGRAKRSARAKAIANQRESKLLHWARTVRINIGRLPKQLDTLTRRVEASFRDFRLFERDDVDARFTISANAVIAYVRHERTNYESLLGEISSKPGCNQAYIIIRDRVDDAIEKRLASQYGSKWRSGV